jgi:DNA invertase Pin-like site-specific DNA recombinase
VLCHREKLEKSPATPAVPKVRAELQIVSTSSARGIASLARIDGLARNRDDLQDFVRAAKAKASTLKAREQPVDTGNSYGYITVNFLGCFADFETNLRK